MYYQIFPITSFQWGRRKFKAGVSVASAFSKSNAYRYARNLTKVRGVKHRVRAAAQ